MEEDSMRAMVRGMNKAQRNGKGPRGIVEAGIEESAQAMSEPDDGPDFVASLDEEGLADFLDADAEPAQYGREAIPDNPGSGMSRVEDDEGADDWATY